MSRPLTCSECPSRLEHPDNGRPKTTCSSACRAKRRNRLRKEERALEAQNLAIEAENRRRDEVNAKYLREDFGPWARGEVPR